MKQKPGFVQWIAPPAACEHFRQKPRQERIYGLRIPPKEHGSGASVSFA
ncbi:MAG: hypothetical protein FWC64_10685 [Treponema sp.]|nr:hypothetical protein [Treponema sp.]